MRTFLHRRPSSLCPPSFLIRTDSNSFTSASPLLQQLLPQKGGGVNNILEVGLGVVAKKIIQDVTNASSSSSSSSGLHTNTTSPTTSSLLLPPAPSTSIPQSLLSKLTSIQEAMSRGYADMATSRQCGSMVTTSPADEGGGGMSYPRTSLLGLGNPICNAVVYGLYVLGHRDASFEVYRTVLELRRTRRELWIQFQTPSTSPSEEVDLVEIDAQYGGGLFTFVDSADEAERLCQTVLSPSTAIATRSQIPQHTTATKTGSNIAVLTGVSLSELKTYATKTSPGTTIFSSHKEDALRRLATTVLLPLPFQQALEELLVRLDTTLSTTAVSSTHRVSSSSSSSSSSGIRMWATGGTALGAIRHPSPSHTPSSSTSPLPSYKVSQVPSIPWDDDIDFCMMDTQEALLQSTLNFPVGILPSRSPSRDGGDVLSGGGAQPGLFLEFCPLFGYKIYSLKSKRVDDENHDAYAPTFGQYGCFVDVFLMSRQDSSKSTGAVDAVLSLPSAQQAWPKEVFRNIQHTSIGSGGGADSSLLQLPTITPLEIMSTSPTSSSSSSSSSSPPSTLLNHFGVLNGSSGDSGGGGGGVTDAYLHRTFGGSRGEVLVGSRTRPLSYLTCGVVPKDQHGRNFSHTIYIPLQQS